MSGGGTGGGGIIIHSARTPGDQKLITKADGQQIVDLLNVAGNTTLAALLQPIVDDAT